MPQARLNSTSIVMRRRNESPAFQPSVAVQNVGSLAAGWVAPSTNKTIPRLHVSRPPRQRLVRVRFPDGHRTAREDAQQPRCSTSTWDKLTAHEFDARVADSSLAICFVGMSNCGKSHWSRQLRDHRGFHVVSVDDKIEHAIKPELMALGFAGIDGMAEWMGFPSDERFSVNQARYLGHEESITAAISPASGVNCVLDTTGSVVYLSQDTLGRLQMEYLVVHLEASDDMLEMMTQNYFQTPKPVVWGDAYKPVQGETPNESLRRCYPDLLRERRKKYAAISHVTIPASFSLSCDVGLDKFLSHVKSKLR